MSAYYGPTPTQKMMNLRDMYRKLENNKSTYPDLTKEDEITYFNNQKTYESYSMYDSIHNLPVGWNQNLCRDNERRKQGWPHDRIYEEEKNKIVPVLTSFWHGRPTLPVNDIEDKQFCRRDQYPSFYRRNSINLDMELEQQPH